MILHDPLRRALRNFARWVWQMPELLLLSTLDEGDAPTLIEITVHGVQGSGRLTIYSEHDPEGNRRRFVIPEAEIPAGGRA